jgi:hypothetical protein
MTHVLQLALDEKNKNGNLLSIYAVEVGKNCACFCPECLEPLEAKNKNKSADKPLLKGQKIAHFAHYDGSICASAPETAIHLLAKKVLQETKTLFVPSIYHRNIELWVGQKILFDNVEVEKEKRGNSFIIKPDAILVKAGKELFVEFFKTHKVDSEKTEKIKKINTSCIEININSIEPLVNGKPNKKGLKHFFENNIYLRTWIFNSQEEDLYKKHIKNIEDKKRLIEEKEQEKRRQEGITQNSIAARTEIFKTALFKKGYEFVKVYRRYNKDDCQWEEYIYCRAFEKNEKNKCVELSNCESCEFHHRTIREGGFDKTVACGFKNNLSENITTANSGSK